LIGTIISAVLLAALYTVFQGLLRTQTNAYAALQETAPRSHVIDVIRKDLVNIALPTGVLTGSLLGQTTTQGTAHWDTLELYTSTGRDDSTAPWGEMQKVDYALVDAGDQGTTPHVQLTRTVLRNLLSTDIENVGETTVLLDNVGSLQFEYYDGTTWTDSWDSTSLSNAIPTVIHVRIGFESSPDKGLSTAPIDIVCEVAAQKPATA
jgi:hypothetical protein